METVSKMRKKALKDNFSSFFNYISNLLSLSQEGKEALSDILEKKTYDKEHLLLKEGAVCRNLYFIESGIAKVFYLKDGKEIVHWLGAENSIAVSISSFLTQQPSLLNIELLERSTIISIPYECLEKLYKASHEIERMGRLLTNNALILMQQRFDDLHFSKASERYERLLVQQPTLIQRVPLSAIASFIGISQETLSRIRHS